MRKPSAWTLAPVALTLLTGCGQSGGGPIEVPVPGEASSAASAPSTAPQQPSGPQPVAGALREIPATTLCTLLLPDELPFGPTPPQPRPRTSGDGSSNCEWRSSDASVALTYDISFAGVSDPREQLAGRPIRQLRPNGASCAIEFNRSYGGIRIDARSGQGGEGADCDLARRTADTVVDRFPMHEPSPGAPSNAPVTATMTVESLCNSATGALTRTGLTNIPRPLAPLPAPDGALRCASPGPDGMVATIRRELPRPLAPNDTEPNVNGRTVRQGLASQGCGIDLPKASVTVNIHVERQSRPGAEQCADAVAIATEIDKSVR